MQETQSMKQENFIGYRLQDDIYYLVDFATNEILDQMDKVAILHDGDVLLKHGSIERVYPIFERLRKEYNTIDLDHNLNLIFGLIPIDELDKILAISDYIGRFQQNFIINETIGIS